MSGWTSVSGSNVSLVVSDASPNGDETYEWYRGATGNTSALISTSNAVAVAPLETTQYWLRTKRAACNADTAAITVTICIPKITAQPAGGMIASGTSKTLSVTATGTPAMSYQWYVGASGNTASPIAGATAASYTTPNLTASATYWVRITCPQQSCGTNSINSTAATVTVCQPPVITQQPSSQTLTNSQSRTLSVTATGDGLQYQWYQGTAGVTTTPIGTNRSTVSVYPGSTKSYWVRVTGTCGTADSSVALLSVIPVITTQPVQPILCGLGNSVTFSIAASGSPLSYQWYRQYYNQSAVAVGTTTTISIPIAQLPANVYCIVTSGNASNYSNVIEITATSPPPTVYSITKGPAGTGRYWLQSNVLADDRPLVLWKWYEGAAGNVAGSALLYDAGYNEVIYVTPSSLPKSYWVRVLYQDTGCSADAGITLP
jgi:Ig-like domain CHU_C associated